MQGGQQLAGQQSSSGTDTGSDVTSGSGNNTASASASANASASPGCGRGSGSDMHAVNAWGGDPPKRPGVASLAGGAAGRSAGVSPASDDDSGRAAACAGAAAGTHHGDLPGRGGGEQVLAGDRVCRGQQGASVCSTLWRRILGLTAAWPVTRPACALGVHKAAHRPELTACLPPSHMLPCRW